MQDVLSELYAARLERLDEYVASAWWIKCTLTDTMLPGNLLPFGLLFGRKLHTALDAVVPTRAQWGPRRAHRTAQRRKQD